MKSLFYLTLIIACLNDLVWGVTSEQAQREVLVYLSTDTTIVIPPPSISANFTQTVINYQPLAETLSNYPVEVIEKADPSFNRADTIAYDSAGNPIKLLDLSRLFRVRLLPDNNPDSLAAKLNSLGGEIIYAHSNGKGTRLADPNDAYFSLQWGLKNTQQQGGIAGEDIKAIEAWETTTGSSNIRIAIIDDHVDQTHPEFVGRLIRSEPFTSYSHGTHVGGIAAATGNNDSGIAGVNWTSKIISEDIYEGHVTFDEVRAYNKIVDAVQNWGAHILNNSYATTDYGLTLQSAFAFAYKMNRVMIAGAGNDGNSGRNNYPAAYPQGVIAVGSTTPFGTRRFTSHVGSYLDVAAPGENIYSTLLNNTYGYDNGTSMACAFVSGVASLLKSFRSNLWNDDIQRIIELTADDKGAPGWDNEFGYGRINAKRALDVLKSPYVLFQQTTTGGTDVATVGPYVFDIHTHPILPDGQYLVYRHEIRKNVSFPKTLYASPNPITPYGWPAAWGRGVGTTGYDSYIPNFAMGFCGVVNGSVTTTGCQLYTFVYDFYSLNGLTHYGFSPATPSNVTFAYSVLGEPVLEGPAASATYPELDYVCSPDSGCRWRVKALKLNFTENNINEEGMVVERKDATNNTWQEIATLPPNATTFTDNSNLMGSQTYTYRIRAFNVARTANSNEITIKTPPKPGVNFKAVVGSVTTYCINEGMGGNESGEFETASGGGEIELLGPPGYCTYKTNKVFLTWNTPANQNPTVPIVNYRVDAYWLKNRSAMCQCWGCFPVTQLWETYEQSVTSTSTSAIICTQQPDTLYSFYITAFDALGDSSFLWIKNLQICPPDSKLVVQAAYAYPGDFCVNPCCGFAKATSKTDLPGSSRLPTEFALGPNSPNPFNPSTTIRYALPQSAKVELRIFNILGQLVRKLVDETKPAGYHEAVWDGKDKSGRSVSTGIYLYQIKAGDFVKTMKMTFMK